MTNKMIKRGNFIEFTRLFLTSRKLNKIHGKSVTNSSVSTLKTVIKSCAENDEIKKDIEWGLYR